MPRHSFESICSEITINKVKYCLLSFYRTERGENKKLNIQRFFKELAETTSKITCKYDNVILMGDINIDSHDKKSPGFEDLKMFKDTFGFSNLIKDKTCFFKDHESSIDVILTNRPTIFKNTFSYELGISDCHKMIGTYLKTTMPILKPKQMTYRSFKI